MFFSVPKSKIDTPALQALFESQKENLVEKGFAGLLNISSEDFRSKLDSFWEEKRGELGNYFFSKGAELPFLLVVKTGDRKKKLELAGASTELDLSQVRDREQAPSADFYLLLDVEDGRKETAKSPAESLKRFAKAGHHPLNFDECLALITQHPEILKDHYIISPGTFVTKGEQELPLLWLLDDNDRPELHYAWFDIAHGHYGSASCSARV